MFAHDFVDCPFLVSTKKKKRKAGTATGAKPDSTSKKRVKDGREALRGSTGGSLRKTIDDRTPPPNAKRTRIGHATKSNTPSKPSGPLPPAVATPSPPVTSPSQERASGIVFTEAEKLSHPATFNMIHETAECSMHPSIWQLFAANAKIPGRTTKVGYGAVDCNHNDVKVGVLASLVQSLAGDPAEIRCVTNQLDHDKMCMLLTSVVSGIFTFSEIKWLLSDWTEGYFRFICGLFAFEPMKPIL